MQEGWMFAKARGANIHVGVILNLLYQELILSCYVDHSNNLQAHHCHILYHELEIPIITLKLVLIAFDSSD